jgi:hypothetical protein
MPLFFTAKEDRNRLTRSPPGSLRRTRPLIPRISDRGSPPRTRGALLLDAQPPAASPASDGATGSPMNIHPPQTPPAQDTHFLDDVTLQFRPPPPHAPVQNRTRPLGLYHPSVTQGEPEMEDIITRTHRQVALAAEAELVADRAIEAARAAVQEARRLLVELEQQIGTE